MPNSTTTSLCLNSTLQKSQPIPLNNRRDRVLSVAYSLILNVIWYENVNSKNQSISISVIDWFLILFENQNQTLLA